MIFMFDANMTLDVIMFIINEYDQLMIRLLYM